MAVLRDFRRIADALERLAAGQSSTRNAVQRMEGVTERLDTLELERHQFEAEMEGLLLKSEGKLKAANNSEARERHQREKHERDLDPFSDDSEEIQRRIPDLDAESVEAEEVQTVPLGLETNTKAHALRAKFS